MRFFNIFIALLLLLCFIGCSSGGSGGTGTSYDDIEEDIPDIEDVIIPTHDLSASLDCEDPNSVVGDVIHFPIVMYNNSDTTFDDEIHGGINWILELNLNDEGYITYYENSLAFLINANSNVLSGIYLSGVGEGEYEVRLTIANDYDTTDDNNVYYYSTVVVSAPTIIAPESNG